MCNKQASLSEKGVQKEILKTKQIKLKMGKYKKVYCVGKNPLKPF